MDKEKIEGWNEDEAEEMERITLRKAVSEATHEGDILNVLKKSAPKNIAVKLMQKKYEIRFLPFTVLFIKLVVMKLKKIMLHIC